MKIVVISDTHERHLQVRLPKGDVLVHCGDFTVNGNLTAIENFGKWIERQPFEHKLVIAGNHDLLFESNPAKAKAHLLQYAPSVTYLCESSVTIEGEKFYGAPWTPRFYDWAFNVDRDKLHEKWAKIPNDTTILITHGPAFGALDLNPHGTHVGCSALEQRIRHLPELTHHFFGHIHHSHGARVRRDVEDETGFSYLAVNASICDEAYDPTQRPFVVDTATGAYGYE